MKLKSSKVFIANIEYVYFVIEKKLVIVKRTLNYVGIVK